jgi:hypothetical protein
MRHTTQHALRCGRGAAAPYINAILIAATVAGTLSISLAPALAGAEVRVEPDNNVVVQADNASVREILDRLSGKFNLTYKLPPNLDRVRTGLYSGTLHQVLARILDGNDYIVQAGDEAVEIVVFGASRLTPIVTADPTPAPAAAGANKAATFAPNAPASSKPPQPPPLSSYLPGNGTTALSSAAAN